MRQNTDDYIYSIADAYFPTYCANMEREGAWGDHVTLQAAADYYGLGPHIIVGFIQRFEAVCP